MSSGAETVSSSVGICDRAIAMTFFKSKTAEDKIEERYTARALASRIRTVTASRKDQLPWLKFARFGDQRTDKRSLRHDANVLGVTGIEADYDGGQIPLDEAVERLEKQGIAAIVYTSPSHTEAAPRWRVLCPLAAELPPERRGELLGRLNGLFGGIFAGESWTLSQSYYFGSLNHNPSHRVELIEGLPLDQHDDLDAIWVGKPNTAANPALNGERVSGPIDEPAQLAEIINGSSYHLSTMRLLGRWARQGVPYMEARGRLVAAFETVFPPDRDDRWRKRFADIDRCLDDIYGKEARKLDEREAAPAADYDGCYSSATENGETEAATDSKPEAATDSKPEDATRADRQIPGLAEFLSAEQWLKRDFPEPEPLLGDLIVAGVRMFLVGSTGLGKTLLGFGMAVAMASGAAFLHWQARRPVRVLYIDGEMPGALIRQRLRDAVRRPGVPELGGRLTIFARDMEDEIAAQFPTVGRFQPLNTEAGINWLLAFIDALGGVDIVAFDNVMSLLEGVQKEEETWSGALPLVDKLSRRRIAQVWLDHTGHNAARQYGTSTKGWRFDTIGIMTALPDDQRQPREVAFTISFEAPAGKARRRTPDNWRDFETVTIRLTDDRWTSEPATANGAAAGGGAGKVSPSRQVFYDAVVAAITKSPAGPGRTTLATWELACLRRGLIEKPPTGDAKEIWQQRDARYRKYRTAKSDLLAAKWIAIEDDMVIDLKGRWA